MSRSRTRLSRRDFLRASGATLAALPLTSSLAWGRVTAAAKRPKVAAVFTEFTYRSHAHVLLENFLEKYLFNGQLTDSGVDVVSFYADQLPKGDMSKQVAAEYGIPIYKTIDQALCLGGQDLAVDAVLSIGEHGKYPHNELDQHMYPRKEFFDQIVAVMKRSNRFVPLYNDKHLSYRWDWAKEMYDTTVKLGIPFMAGSSVPLAQRQPPLEIPAGAKIEEAISVHGGGVESYDFHALEVLQSMVEARHGGETGVARVQFLDHDALWKAADEGRWSVSLATAAVEANLGRKIDNLRDLEQERGPAYGVLVTYKDGLRGLALRLAQSGTHWNFACRYQGNPQPHATSYYVGPWQNRNLFKALSHAIQYHFIHGKAPYPVERTLLVTGVLDASMHSRHQKGKPLDTPQLEFAYAPRDYRQFREMGASWKILTEDIPEPHGINPNGTKE
ncbi:MAG: twin-arginine translocation signal domain-containing protein [Pirellulales bacterium]